MSFTSFLSDRQAPGGQSGQPQTANQLFGSTTFQSQPTGATEFVADNHGGAPSSNAGGLPTDSTTPQLATASDLFNTSAYDPAKLHPLANLGDNLDYLLTDEAKLSALPGAQSALPSRGWSDELSYGVGSTYLSGLAFGGLWGVQEGMRRDLGTSSFKLRLNSVLNSVTRRGIFLGNSLGVLALMYNAVNSTIDAFRGQHDFYGGMGAAAISGAIFKCTAGVKPALAGATLMMGASAAWTGAKKLLL